nr:MAG TPA: hypothetical protein [Caudoviricetes sp.]
MSTSSGPARPRSPPRPRSLPTTGRPTGTRLSTPTRAGSG